jgi:hypothetical protein
VQRRVQQVQQSQQQVPRPAPPAPARRTGRRARRASDCGAHCRCGCCQAQSGRRWHCAAAGPPPARPAARRPRPRRLRHRRLGGGRGGGDEEVWPAAAAVTRQPSAATASRPRPPQGPEAQGRGAPGPATRAASEPASQPQGPRTPGGELVLDHLDDALLDGARHVQALDRHLARLAHAPAAPHRLLLQRAVQARLQQEHVAGGGQVDAHLRRGAGRELGVGGQARAGGLGSKGSGAHRRTARALLPPIASFPRIGRPMRGGGGGHSPRPSAC